MTDRILILDFGSQVTQLIARRVREAGVYCEIVPYNKALKAIKRLKPEGIILSGGPASVTGDGTPYRIHSGHADPPLVRSAQEAVHPDERRTGSSRLLDRGREGRI